MSQSSPSLADLAALLERRRSCRAFLERPVPRADLERILTAARQAPSGANLQPGRFHVLAGAPLAGFCDAMAAAAEGPAEPPEYGYFPQPLPPELKARQRAAGYALYAALGIDRRDLAGRRAQFAANYRFFGAPVAIVVTIRRDMGAGCYMDLGMALMALMLAAEAAGYGTCGIGALAQYGRAAHRALALPEEELVVCGIALGHPDPEAPVNRVRTERAPLGGYASFRGWPGEVPE
ncbi:nitroreductase [Poseidonocella sp. HB161398]|uniref:nitroreductase n=1 Tax=Poseidonocella sp. HB161398 TaxID=2320855 RepID=UPI00110802FE|nr:nitroreductase [Poseidonocella sp. HB161398]